MPNGLVLSQSCEKDDKGVFERDFLKSTLSDCDRERELFEEVENLIVTVVYNKDTGLFYFREVIEFDSQNNLYICTIDEKFKQDGLHVLITGELKLFSEQEKEILGPVPSATELYFLELENIEAID